MYAGTYMDFWAPPVNIRYTFLKSPVREATKSYYVLHLEDVESCSKHRSDSLFVKMYTHITVLFYYGNTCKHSAVVLCMLTEVHSRFHPSHQHSGGTSAEGTDTLRH